MHMTYAASGRNNTARLCCVAHSTPAWRCRYAIRPLLSYEYLRPLSPGRVSGHMLVFCERRSQPSYSARQITARHGGYYAGVETPITCIVPYAKPINIYIYCLRGPYALPTSSSPRLELVATGPTRHMPMMYRPLRVFSRNNVSPILQTGRPGPVAAMMVG